MRNRSPKDAPPDDAKAQRLAREAGALRANLAKRKAQARQRAAESASAATPSGSERATRKPG